MLVATHGQNHAIGRHHVAQSAQIMQREMASEGPSRGERLVARLDQDRDGALSPSELKDTKFGNRMSIDKFARLDANSDGMLEAGELDAMKKHGRKHENHTGPGMMESIVRAQYADYLAEKTDADDGMADVAARVIEKLDGDQSGGLNSEEIAGTRLAKLIAGDFYQIDADKNGALSRTELSGFIADHLLGQSSETIPDPADDGEVGLAILPGEAETEGTPETDASGPQLATSEVDGTPSATDPSPITQFNSVDAASSSAARTASIATAFEAALEILKNGSGTDNPYDVVQTLYGDVQKILASG